MNLNLFETVNVDYVGKKEAIAIANNDKTLKQAIFTEGKKAKMLYGLIIFHKFKIRLVKWGSYFAWHIKVVSGEWGASEYINILGYKFQWCSWDGDFTEEDNINCLVLVDNGQFIYLKPKDLECLEEADEKEYKEYIKYKSFWVSGKKENKIKKVNQIIKMMIKIGLLNGKLI